MGVCCHQVCPVQLDIEGDGGRAVFPALEIKYLFLLHFSGWIQAIISAPQGPFGS